MDRKKIYSLDALKSISAVLILFYHYQLEFRNTSSFSGIHFYGGRFYFGYIVELFFMISGYLTVTGNSERSRTERMICRIERIFPMAALMTIMSEGITFLYCIQFHEWFMDQPHGIWNFFAEVFLIFAGGPMKYEIGVNNPIWYLCVLLECTAIFYLLDYISDRLHIPGIFLYAMMSLLGMGISSFEISIPFFNEYSARGLAPFFAGAAIPTIIKLIPRKTLNIVSSFILATVMVAYLFFRTSMIDDEWSILVYLMYPALIVLCIQGTLFKKLLEHSIFELPGRISFEFYLLNAPMLLTYELIIREFHLKIVHDNVWMVCFAVITEIVALLIYKLIEIPLNNWVKSKHEHIMNVLKG